MRLKDHITAQSNLDNPTLPHPQRQEVAMTGSKELQEFTLTDCTIARSDLVEVQNRTLLISSKAKQRCAWASVQPPRTGEPASAQSGTAAMTPKSQEVQT